MRITNNLPNAMNVNWELTTTCNYKCWYCPDDLHDGRYRWPDLETSLEFFSALCETQEVVHLDMAGGEPTLWPEMDEFLSRRPANLRVEVSTNGSRTINWWKKNYPHMDGVCISFHPDSADPDHIYDLCSELTKFEDKILHVHILAVRDKLDLCQRMYDRLYESGFQMSCRFKMINAWRKEMSDKITDDNGDARLRKMMRENSFARNTAPDYISKPGKAFLDGQPIDGYTVPVDGLNSFKGWLCNAGRNRLHILRNGDVYRASCMNGGKLGNMVDFRLTTLLEPTLCLSEKCLCSDEIVLEKHNEF